MLPFSNTGQYTNSTDNDRFITAMDKYHEFVSEAYKNTATQVNSVLFYETIS